MFRCNLPLTMVFVYFHGSLSWRSRSPVRLPSLRWLELCYMLYFQHNSGTLSLHLLVDITNCSTKNLMKQKRTKIFLVIKKNGVGKRTGELFFSLFLVSYIIVFPTPYFTPCFSPTFLRIIFQTFNYSRCCFTLKLLGMRTTEMVLPCPARCH